jgi:hypothetical protein
MSLTPAASGATRYEKIMAGCSVQPGDLAARFARASRAARAAVEAGTEREAAIRDVAAGVATQPGRLAEAPWLFNSFIKSDAADVCARLGLAMAQYRPTMLACGVSVDPEVRADQPRQAHALLRFVDLPEVTRAVEARISAMRGLVLDYATQHALAEADTGLVDIGWTGRMAASLISVCEAAGMARPHILFWGHEPRPATGWTDPERVGSYVYNTATGQGLGWRVPDAPFVMENVLHGRPRDRLRVST